MQVGSQGRSVAHKRRAAVVPFTKNRLLYNGHWFWATGNGDIGNQGVHEMDIARWGSAWICRARWWRVEGNTITTTIRKRPNRLIARFDYGDKEAVFEVRGLQTGGEADFGVEGGNCIRNLFYGDQGWMALDANGDPEFRSNDGTFDNEETNRLANPPYRAPYVVPQLA